MTHTRNVETSTFLAGRFKGDTLRVEFIGRFDFDRSVAEVGELRVLVRGERHEGMELDRALDVSNKNFGWVLADAAERDAHVTGNHHANHLSGHIGDDRLMGGDRLESPSGDDVRRGRAGADVPLSGSGKIGWSEARVTTVWSARPTKTY